MTPFATEGIGRMTTQNLIRFVRAFLLFRQAADGIASVGRAHLPVLFGFVGLFFLSPVAYGGTVRHDVPDSAYLDLAAEYEAVGRFAWLEGDSGLFATGTLIDPQWVLAAGHSFDGNDLVGGGISEVSFEVGDGIYDADLWIPHPGWTSSSGDFFSGTDIALVRLTESVPDVTPVALYQGSEEFLATSTIVGFGATGTGLTGAISATTEKRGGNNEIDLIFGPDNDNRILGTDFDNPLDAADNAFGSPDPLALEFQPASGDSGGGLFIELDGTPRLAGVISFFSAADGAADGDYGDRAGYTRVSKFVSWIHDELPVVPGDFDLDRALTAADIDLLTSEVQQANPDVAFDLNSDGVVNQEDRRVWVEDLKRTEFGDANLDQVIDASDFSLWTAHRFSSASGWASADFDGNGLTDGSDFNLIVEGHAILAAAVPEPNSVSMWWILLLGLGGWRLAISD